MQLKKLPPSRSFRNGLTLAAGALLGSGAAHADGDWLVNMAVMSYNESDGRVQAVEPVLDLTNSYGDENTFNLRLVADTLTGASPNGAARASKVQTFTSASSFKLRTSSLQTLTRSSGGSIFGVPANYEDDAPRTYDVQSGDLPADPSFRDTRLAISMSDTKVLNTLSWTYGGAYSHEHDFASYSLNSAVAKDFNDKNTTVSFGVNAEHDSSSPFGGIPVPLTSYFDAGRKGNSDSKSEVDAVLGFTQILSRRWFVQLNFSGSTASGYQNDPYKILTLANNGNLEQDPNHDGQYLYLYESRPDSRRKSSVYLKNKIAVFDDDAVDLSYRHMTDDWGIKSDTVDFTYHWQMGEHAYLEPHYRYYKQTAADFYKPFLQIGPDAMVENGNITPSVKYASADPRLAAFGADTFGLKWGYHIGRDNEFSVRLEYYQQHDNNALVAVPQGSNLDGYSQFAPLKAVWLQLGYSYRW